MPGSKGALSSCVLAEGELEEVRRRAELVMSVQVAVVHKYPIVAINQAEDACSLYRFCGLLQGSRWIAPLSAFLSCRDCEAASRYLTDAASAFVLVESVIKAVVLVVDDVHIYGSAASVVEVNGLTLQVCKVLICIGIEDFVVAHHSIIRENREIDEILACNRVVDSLRSPHASDVGEVCSCVSCGEVNGAASPVDEVVGTHEHHTSIAAPSECGTHIGSHHIEASVLASQDMWVAKAVHNGVPFCSKHRLTLVDDGIVVAVIRDCIVDVLVGIAGEEGEEVVRIWAVLLVNIDVEGLCGTLLSNR